MPGPDQKKQLERVTRRIFLETGRGPTDAELAESLNLSLAEVRELKDADKWKYRNSGLNYSELLDLARAALAKDPGLLRSLSPCEREVIRLTLGLEGRPESTSSEICEVLKFRLNLVTRAQRRAIIKLSHWA